MSGLRIGSPAATGPQFQWFDGALAEASFELERNARLEPLGHRHQVGPAGRRIRDAFVKCNADDGDATPIFESKSAAVRHSLQGWPDGLRRPKPDKRSMADRYAAMASPFLVSAGMDTHSGVLTGLFCADKGIGNSWIPVKVDGTREAKALVAWWNSTPAWLMLLSRRTRKLTFPGWSLDHLKDVRVPKPDAATVSILCGAYESVKEARLLPMGRQAEDPARAVLDDAAAEICGVSPPTVRDWRKRLAREPTVRRRT